jgi:hypothetical protein
MMPVMNEQQHSYEVTEQKIPWRSLSNKDRLWLFACTVLSIAFKLVLLAFLAALIFWLVR